MGEQSAAIDGVLPADGNRPASAPRPDGVQPTSRYVKWMRKGGLSILDQGLFAGSNFTINILLARWLVPSEFGAFTLAYSVFLFIGAFYLAAFMEPFLIYGSSKYSGCFRRYFSLVVTWHWRAVAGASLLVCAAAAVLTATGHAAQSMALLGLAASLPFLLQMWLMRTVFYSQLRPVNAAIGSAVFFVVQIGGACSLYAVGWLSPASAFV
nr:hypothetical protein [Planctomycetota bacterium]